MKTIFAKYNSERLAKYQIVTKIVLDKNSQKYAIKEALCDEAKEHIEDIYNNYELLKSSYNINLVKPTKIENGLSFDMAKGISLENILLDAITQNDSDKFKKYIGKFLNFVDDMVCERNVVFQPSQEFEEVFGEWGIDEAQDIIKVANIDLIFGNIFVDQQDNFTLIDYEWVFDFEVPKSYIVWRSLAIFSAYHSVDISRFDSISFINNDYFLSLDDKFSSFVNGESKKYFLAPKVGKSANFINLEKKETIFNYDYFIQLFIENENPISEKNSLKLLVSQNAEIQKFEFDLKDFQNIKNLRLDPFNDSCVIEIEKLNIILNDGSQIDLIPHISANVCSHHAKSYFFEFFDPQIYFENIDFEKLDSIEKLCFEVKYSHISKDAVHVCANQIAADKNYQLSIIEKEKMELQESLSSMENKASNLEKEKMELQESLSSMENKASNLEKEKMELQESLSSMENKASNLEKEKMELQESLSSMENKASNLEKEKMELQESLSSMENKASNLEKEKMELQESLSSMENKASNLENELLDIYTSKSWKFTRRLRNLAKGKL